MMGAMISLDSTHSGGATKSTAESISDLLGKLRGRCQGFFELPDDDALVRSIQAFASSISGRFSEVVLLGIGGSALGPLCLQQSLGHLFGKVREGGRRLHVIDNIDPALIRDLEEVIDLKNTLFLVVTKSGGTPETLAQYFYFKHRVESAGLSLEDHFVFVTDPEKGFLRSLASENPAIPTFPIPPNVGGRFSVLCAVGLLPAALLGFDVEALMSGARTMRDRCLIPTNDNPAFQLASTQRAMAQAGRPIHVFFPYSQRLIRFADWYRQLLAESIGKAKNDKGETVHTGLTPVTALGVTDQHSQSQLYNEGPDDKLFLFVEVENMEPRLEIPVDRSDDDVRFLKGVTFDRLMRTELEGTQNSLTQNGRPHVTVRVDAINETTLGELFMLFQMSVALLGELYEINAFDQPGVELSKIITKQLLT